MKITKQQAINALINLKKIELGIERMDAGTITLFYLNNKLEELNNNVYVDEVCRIAYSLMIKLYNNKIDMQAIHSITRYQLLKELTEEENAGVLDETGF